MPKRRTSSPAASSVDGRQAEHDGEVRKEILAAARNVALRHGLRKLTMDDVARAIGKERSSIYYYFPGKQDLLVALAEEELGQISDAVRSAVARHERASERFVAYMASRTQQVAARADVYRQVLPDLRSGAFLVPEFEELIRTHSEQELRFVARILMDGVAAGEFRPLGEADVMMLARNMIAGMRGIELELLFDPKRAQDLDTQIRVSVDIVLRGLLR